jgi:hypothetical protein
LINDILRRDGVVNIPMIIPVSSSIDNSATERRAYDQILDVFSRPLMRALSGLYEFEPLQTLYPDGVYSNFVCKGYATARPAWRYLCLTPHVSYLANLLSRTVREEMRKEVRYLKAHAQARIAIKAILEMPDMQIDRIIRSAQANQSELSNVLCKEMPQLAEPGVWGNFVEAVRRAFN